MTNKLFALYFLLACAAGLLYPRQASSQSSVQEESLKSIETKAPRRHELFAGYGFLSLPQLGFILGDALGDAFSRGASRKQFIGPILVGYNYFPSEKLSLGVDASYANYINKDISSGQVHSKNHFITVMPQFQYYWARLPRLEFYSGVKVGASFFHQKEHESNVTNTLVPAFHVTQLGVRIGRQKRFFVDSGLGFDGLLNVGYNIPVGQTP